MGVLFGGIKKSGAWYYYGERKWHGKDDVVKDLRNEQDFQAEVAQEVLEAAKNPKLVDQVLPEMIDSAEAGNRRTIKNVE